jgi:DNA helicase IV
VSIRHSGEEPLVVGVDDGELMAELADLVRTELKAVGAGNLAVVVPLSMVEPVDAALDGAGIDHGKATRQGLSEQVTVVPPSLVKGLELDAVVVVEPGRILAEEARGPQSLYVALTRSTKRLVVLHTAALPEILT